MKLFNHVPKGAPPFLFLQPLLRILSLLILSPHLLSLCYFHFHLCYKPVLEWPLKRHIWVYHAPALKSALSPCCQRNEIANSLLLFSWVCALQLEFILEPPSTLDVPSNHSHQSSRNLDLDFVIALKLITHHGRSFQILFHLTKRFLLVM